MSHHLYRRTLIRYPSPEGAFDLELVIRNLSKQYSKSVWGLRNLDLAAGPGVLGLLGPNGAGKSTLMRILATITKPTAGTVTWDGVDIVRSPDAIREVLGYLPQDFGVYPHLDAVEFLEYLAGIKGLERRSARRRIDELITSVNLVEARKRPLGTYSGGMKQRIGIAQALLNDPKILIVDEPTVGLDPEERINFRNLLTDLSGDRIVILSTHIVSDIEAAATRIAVINCGQLLRECAPEELLAEVRDCVWEWVVSSAELEAVRQQYRVSNAIRRADGVEVRAVAQRPPSPSARRVEPALEDAYLHVMSAPSTEAIA